MKQFVIVTLMFSMVSTWAVAQDDIYFTPTKKDKKEVRQYQPPVRHHGCNRDIDEYNRRGNFRSHYNVIGSDSTANDIIDFAAGSPSDSAQYYGDSRYDDDDNYAYSRRMSRFDDYYWRDPFYWDTWYGSPYWYGSAYWYGSPYWYARYGWGWYDPWYYGGWYRPYYYGYYGWGWHHPIYAGHIGGYRPGGWNGYTGTGNHSFGAARGGQFARRGGTTGRGSYTTRGSRNGSRRIVGRSNSSSYGQNTMSRPSYNSGSFGGSRGSIGGSRGSFGGGSRGGGSFGGGGGIHAGGRR